METVNMHEAKTHLSRLVEKAANGESFIIAKNGKPMVKVVAIDAPEKKEMKRIGFLKGIITMQEVEAFKSIGSEEIENMFYGDQK